MPKNSENEDVHLKGRLKELIEELEIDLKKKEKHLKDYKRKAANMEGEIRELKSQLKFSEAVIDHQYSRIEEIESYEKRVSGLEKEKAEKENLLLKSQKKVDSLSSTKNTLEKDLSEKGEKIESYEKRLDSLEKEKAEKESLVSVLQRQIEELQKQVGSLSTTKDTIEKDLSEKDVKMIELEKIISKKEGQISDFRTKLSGIKVKIEKLKEVAEPRIEKKKSLTQKLFEPDKEGALSLEEELDILMENIAEKASKLFYYEGKVASIEEKLKELKAVIGSEGEVSQRD